MVDINKEIEEMSKSMEVATAVPKTLEETILELGPEGLKKALPTLSRDQRDLLVETIENMAKAKKEEKLKKKQGIPTDADPATVERCVKDVKAQGHDKGSAFAICNAAGAGMKKAGDTLEPEIDTTGEGEQEKNEKRPKQLKADEKVADKAKAEKMEDQRHQGGVPVEGWEGQVIKSGDLKAFAKEEAEEGDHSKPAIEGLKELADEEKEEDAPEDKKEEKAKEEKKEDKMEQKESVKKSFKSVVERMISRKLEKSKCVAAICKNMEMPEEKVSQVWDLVEKSMSSDASLDASAKNPEEKQSDMPAHMKDEGKKKELPLSGKSPTDADEDKKPSSDMKKSDGFYYEEEEVYDAAQEVFKSNRFGKNTHWDVDAYIEAEENAIKARLSKSTFLYPSQEEVGAAAEEFIMTGTDMDEKQLASAEEVAKSKPYGGFIVKSFNEEDMDELFENQDMWAKEEKLGKSNDLNKGGPGSGRKGHKTDRKPYQNPNPAKKPLAPIVEGVTSTGKKITSEAKPDAAKPGPNDHKFDKEGYRKTPEYQQRLDAAKKRSSEGFVAPVTESGKLISHRANHPDHHDWSAQDHEDAMAYHRDAQGPLNHEISQIEDDKMNGANRPRSQGGQMGYDHNAQVDAIDKVRQHKKAAQDHADMADYLRSKKE